MEHTGQLFELRRHYYWSPSLAEGRASYRGDHNNREFSSRPRLHSQPDKPIVQRHHKPSRPRKWRGFNDYKQSLWVAPYNGYATVYWRDTNTVPSPLCTRRGELSAPSETIYEEYYTPSINTDYLRLPGSFKQWDICELRYKDSFNKLYTWGCSKYLTASIVGHHFSIFRRWYNPSLHHYEHTMLLQKKKTQSTGGTCINASVTNQTWYFVNKISVVSRQLMISDQQ